MYEKDEDYGNVWAAKQLAAKMTREALSPVSKELYQITETGTKMLYLNPLDAVVANGAKQFTSHEDVMAKLLGKI